MFNLSGNIPVSNDWIIISVNGLDKPGSKYFSNFNDMPSFPDDDLLCKQRATWVIFFSSIRSNLNDERMFWYQNWRSVFWSLYFISKRGGYSDKEVVELFRNVSRVWYTFTLIQYRFDTRWFIFSFLDNLWYCASSFPHIWTICVELLIKLKLLCFFYCMFGVDFAILTIIVLMSENVNDLQYIIIGPLHKIEKHFRVVSYCELIQQM